LNIGKDFNHGFGTGPLAQCSPGAKSGPAHQAVAFSANALMWS
jgi:hypothetical protein